MQAETLNCPNCGAAATTDQPLCKFCSSQLATVACPSCFGLIFVGSKHCPRCGTAAVAPSSVDSELNCPRCSVKLKAVDVGATHVHECDQCLGLWLDVAAFERICADREQQSAVLGAASLAPKGAIHETDHIKYVPCPLCSQLMNRINFARCSGVIVDICKGHGTWFDREELSRIVEFIHGGGLESMRNREKEEIKNERIRLLEDQRTLARDAAGVVMFRYDDRRMNGIGAARGLLKFLLH